MRYVSSVTGTVLGVYRVDTDAGALDELARDHKFADFDAWVDAEGGTAELYVVGDADEALRARGRALFGPTFKGFAWYDESTSAAMLAKDGLGVYFGPPIEACSPFYPTMAEATFHGLRA